jgi:dCTP deaminase
LDINLGRGKFSDLFGANSVTHRLTLDQPFILRPQRLVLAQTLERVAFPIREGRRSLAARVEGKSSFARCGLLVHFTAPTIHAGFEGTIALELINLGPCDIALYPDSPICQLVIEVVSGMPFRNDSQFQGQSRPGGASTKTKPRRKKKPHG